MNKLLWLQNPINKFGGCFCFSQFLGCVPSHRKHVIFVIVPMPGLLPQCIFVDRGCEDLAEAVVWVLGADEGSEFLEYMGAIWVEEWRAGA